MYLFNNSSTGTDTHFEKYLKYLFENSAKKSIYEYFQIFIN